MRRTAKPGLPHPPAKRPHAVYSGVQGVSKPLQYTGKLFDMSASMLRTETEGEEVLSDADILEAAMANEDTMVFAEFVNLMGGERIQEHIPGDWHRSAAAMRAYRNAYDTADVDGDNDVEFEELEMVWTALDPTSTLDHENMEYLWGVINPDKMEGLTFTAFLHGMRRMQDDEKCAGWVDITKPTQWELLSLLIDTPISEKEEKKIMDSLTPVERWGIKLLQNKSRPMDKKAMQEVLTRAGNNKLRELNPTQVKNMASVRHNCVALCAFIGFVWTAFPAAVENYLVSEIGVDGFKDAYWVCHDHTVPPDAATSGSWSNDTDAYREGFLFDLDGDGVEGEMVPTTEMDVEWYRCHINYNLCGTYQGDRLDETHPAWEDMDVDTRCSFCQCQACQCVHHDNGKFDVSLDNKLLWFWIWNGASIGFFVVIEIVLLMYTAVVYCVRVSWALDQRLVPLNQDRAFVADSLVRAAFELGNPDSPALGVDPRKDSTANSKLQLAFMLLMYRIKVVATASVIKQITTLTTTPEFYTYAKPWLGTVLATIFWDGLIAHCIICQAEIRGFGVYTAVEVFNELLGKFEGGVHEVSTFGKIQICRAVGVAIVKSGSMYPTMELLLRHCIQYLGLRGKRVVTEPGTLDNEVAFLNGLGADISADDLTAAGRRALNGEKLRDAGDNLKDVFKDKVVDSDAVNRLERATHRDLDGDGDIGLKGTDNAKKPESEDDFHVMGASPVNDTGSLGKLQTQANVVKTEKSVTNQLKKYKGLTHKEQVCVLWCASLPRIQIILATTRQA